MGPRFINGTGARGSQRQSASGGRGRDRANRPGDGRPGWRKTVGPAGLAGGPSEEPREGVRLADGGGASPDLCRGRALEAGDAGARAARTDRLTDRPTEAQPAPPHPTRPRPHPRAGAASLSRLPRPPLPAPLLFRLRLCSAPAAPVPSPGPGGVPRLPAELSVESGRGGGTFRSSREAAPALGKRCRGSFSREDRGMRRVRPGRVAFVNTSSASRPLGC